MSGDAYLLYLEQNERAKDLVPAEFAEKFARKLAANQQGAGDMRGICNRLQSYHERWGEKWPVWSDPDLPKLKGWQ